MGQPGGTGPEAAPAVIPSQSDLLGDLLNLDLGPPASGSVPAPASGMQMGAVDLLGSGLDTLVGGPTVNASACTLSLQ